MRFVNLTPHPVRIFNEIGEIVLEVNPMPTMRTPRVFQSNQKDCVLTSAKGQAIPVYSARYGEVVNLPPPQPDTFYIVSRMVRQAVEGRKDVVCPGVAIRDDNGSIIGAKGLSY